MHNKNASFKEIKDDFVPRTRDISQMILDIQKNNKTTANKLREELILHGFKKMFIELNTSFTYEGELLLGMCYQLNYLKDCISNFQKLYEDREALLKGTKFKQELYWTKRTHYDNLLYLINIKETIKTGYKVDHKKFDRIIDKYLKKYRLPISVFQMMDDIGYKELTQEKQSTKITLKVLMDESGMVNKKAKK